MVVVDPLLVVDDWLIFFFFPVPTFVGISYDIWLCVLVHGYGL